MNAIETLNYWGGRFSDFALPMLVQSSLLILVLFAFDLVLRNKVRAVVRYALWMLVLVKLILPPSFAAPTGLAYWLPEKKAPQAQPSTAPQFVVRYPDVKFDEVSALPSLPPPRPNLRFAGWVLLSWLATALGLMAWLVRRSRSVMQTAARALPAPESPEQLLGSCLQQMGINRRVRLKLSATASSPAVCGLWRPVILIPQPLADKLSALQLRAVLLHELAHIKRGDVWVHYAQTLLQIIYWWHPLLWLANARIRRVREQAVDEMVMVQMGAEATTYPATLLEVAKLAFKRPMLALGLIGIVESKSALAQRIHSMINRPIPRSARLGFTGLAALFLAGAAFLPMARGQRTPYQAPRVASESAPVVAMDVKFIEIEESGLAALGLGEPPVTEFNGHRAWALSPEQLNGVLQRALEQAGTDVLTAPRVTTVSGRQTQTQVVDIIPVAGTEIRVGPTCDLTPYVTGDLIDLAVAATVTERRPVDPTAPFASVADAFVTNEVGTARVLIGDGGGVVLENPEARSSKGNRYLVIVSATIVSADRAAESQTLNQASTIATGAPTQKQEVPAATFQNTTQTRPAKSQGVRPTDATTKGDASAGEGGPLTVTITKTEPHLYIGLESVTIEELKTRLQRAASRNPAVTLSLRVDADASVGEIEKVMDAAKEAGIKSVSSVAPRQKSTVTPLETAKQLFERRRAKFGLWYPTIPPRPAESPSNPPGSTVKESERNSAGDGAVPLHGSRPVQVPVLGNLPFLGPGRMAIQAKLNRTVLPEIGFDNVRLLEAIQWLAKESTDRDPDGTGVNFLVNPNVIPIGPETMINPNTSNWVSLPQPAPLDMNTVFVRIKPPLRNVRLADALEAIVRVADKPIRYSIEDYAVVFSQKSPDTKQLETRFFRVNPQTFLQRLRENFRGTLTTNELGLTLRDFLAAAGVNVLPPNMVYYKDRAGILMVRATVEELDRVQAAIDALNAVPQNKSSAKPRVNSPTGERTANGDADKDSGIVAESAAWARTYVCGGFRLRLDADGTYLASFEEDGVRRSERGTWKKHGREFVLERQTGDLQYAIRRLRVDDRQPTHLLWVPEVSNLSGAIEYFSFKPTDEAPSPSDSKDPSESEKPKPRTSSAVLETRTFRVDPHRFLENLRKQMAGDVSTNVVESVRRFFEGAGVNVFPPNLVYYNDRRGLLMVRATAKELDIVQNTIETLTLTAPRQILIETRFIEAPTDFLRKVGLDAIQTRPGEQGWARVFTTAEARALLQATTMTAGVDVLSAPRVTTLEGRQTQIQAGEVQAVATDINPQAKNAPGLTSTNGVAPSPYLTSPVTLGASLDLIPEVAEDGYTLRVLALPTVIEFLGYDRERAEATKARVWIDGNEQAVAPPLPIFRTRQMQATANLYDGQTLVLGGAVPVVIERPNGKSEAKTVAEDDTKRLLVAVTLVLIDPAGNPIHAPGKEPFPIDKVPPQPPR